MRLGRVGLHVAGDLIGGASQRFLELGAGGLGRLGLLLVGLVGWGTGETGGVGVWYHGLAHLGVGVFAECVCHGDGFGVLGVVFVKCWICRSNG